MPKGTPTKRSHRAPTVAADNVQPDGRRKCEFCGVLAPGHSFYASTKRFCSHSCCNRHSRSHQFCREPMKPTPKRNPYVDDLDSDEAGAGDGRDPASPAVARQRSRGSSDSSRSRKKARKRDRKERPPAARSSTRMPPQPRSPRRTPTTFRTHGSNESDDDSAQVFSTQFISAMYVDDSESLHGIRHITDTWRQKYNDPIQIPSGASKEKGGVRPPPEKVELDFEIEPFTRPQAYVRQTRATTDCDLDHQDRAWLGLYNARNPGSALDERMMEELLYEFEKQAYQGLTRENVVLEQPNIEDRVDTVCDVCKLGDSEPGNQIVFCDGCDLSVHQRCYGVPTIPEGEWLCDPCKAGNHAVSCTMCPVKGGALKRIAPSSRGGVAEPEQYCHILCGLWVPEIDMPNPMTDGPLDTTDVPLDRKRLVCCLCKTKQGACIQCQAGSCTTAFHVMCAVQEGIRMDLALGPDGGILRKAFCSRHKSFVCEETVLASQSQNFALQSARANARRLAGPSTEFCDYVSLPQVEEDLNVTMDLIQAMFPYWVQKRRDRFRKPLLRQFVRRSERRDHSPMRRAARGRARQTLLDTRLSLERGRSLCEMIRRRETKKRELYRVIIKQFAASTRTFASTLGLDLAGALDSTFWATEDESGRRMSKPTAPNELIKIVLDALRKDPCSGPFWFPVTTDVAPDYYDIIDNPMDLQTLQRNLDAGLYKDSIEAFVADLELMFQNCHIYNAPDSTLVEDVKVLEELADGWKREYLEGSAASAKDGAPSASAGAAHASAGRACPFDAVPLAPPGAAGLKSNAPVATSCLGAAAAGKVTPLTVAGVSTTSTGVLGGSAALVNPAAGSPSSSSVAAAGTALR